MCVWMLIDFNMPQLNLICTQNNLRHARQQRKIKCIFKFASKGIYYIHICDVSVEFRTLLMNFVLWFSQLSISFSFLFFSFLYFRDGTERYQNLFPWASIAVHGTRTDATMASFASWWSHHWGGCTTILRAVPCVAAIELECIEHCRDILGSIEGGRCLHQGQLHFNWIYTKEARRRKGCTISTTNWNLYREHE